MSATSLLAPEKALSKGEKLLEVENLSKHFSLRAAWGQKRLVRAVDGVSFSLAAGEVLALVGESGCGKSTLSLSLMNLEKPTSGRVSFKGEDVSDLKGRALKDFRQEIQMIFQDPYESLNPLMRVSEIVTEPLRVHGLYGDSKERERVGGEGLEQVGLSPAESFLNRYPHELSGGQRQRVAIASALMLKPSLLIADEPVSMLDVSIRAEVLAILAKLKQERNIAMIFITHDMSTAAYVADRIAVMYLGKIVEIAPSEALLKNPQHPYTKALLSVIPIANPRQRRERKILKGDPPSALNIPSGCRFHPRCPVAVSRCREEEPLLSEVDGWHQAACLLLHQAGQGLQP
ncbi:MAG: ABC transporter ATP-binding protein [Deinococcales bacterium]